MHCGLVNFVGDIELPKWQGFVVMDMLEDEFTLNWCQAAFVFVDPCEDGILQGISGRLRMCWQEAFNGGGVSEVGKAVLDVLFVCDGAWPKIIVGIGEENICIRA